MSTNSGKFERRRIRSYGVRRPSRNPARGIADRGGAALVPREFFCPISKKFMADPVTIPNSHLTYDRKSVEHLHKAPEDVLPDLRMRKRMDTWFSQYKIEHPFDSVNSRGFFIGSVISVATKREESLLREFVTVMKRQPHYLADGWGMWCVARLLSCEPPSGNWVLTALSLATCVDSGENLVAPEGIDPGIDPNYSLLRPINDALKEERQWSHDLDFKHGLINFMYALVMSSPDISSMEGKLTGIVPFLARKLWANYQIYKFGYYNFGWYLKQFLTLERLCRSLEFRESIFEAEVIRTLLDVMNYAIFKLENINNGESILRAPETIGTGMRILEILCQPSKKARVQLRENIGAKFLFPTLFHHMKIVGDYVEVSEVFAAHFSAEPETPVRINVHLEPHEMPVPVENEYDDIENENDDNDSETDNDD